MRSLLCLVLLVVLSVRNDAQLLRNIPLADPNLNIPAPIEPLINVNEFLEILGDEVPSQDQNGADPNLPAPMRLLIDTDKEVDFTRSNLSVGSIGSGDTLFYRSFFHREGIANTVRSVTIDIRGLSPITAIRATEQGTSQNARATITSGGLGSNAVGIRLTSDGGRGFHYLVEVWRQ